ncbi:MAG: hypothetical protein CMJ18_03440 [Phycisphaeraceae bacterium]|nr:hypothetical protein [Phycisphaeraceae bacterium]
MNDGAIRFGIVGLGRAGWDIHVNSLKDRAGARIVAVVDQLPARRAEAEQTLGCKAYSTLGAMLKRDDLDVVTVATPSARHAPDTKKALASGRHVIVEKPMALSVAQADGMIEAARKAGRHLFVHQNYRFNREFTHLEETIRSGRLGRLFHIRFSSCAFSRRFDWQTLSKHGGGVLNNTGPHYVDQILRLLGSPVAQAMGDLQQITSAGDVEDHVKALIRAENGTTADMEISNVVSLPQPVPRWILYGTHGTLTSDGRKAVIRWLDPSELPPLEAVDGPVMSRSYENIADLNWQVAEEDTVGPDIGSFYDNVCGVLRGDQEMLVTPESVREVIRTIAMIRKGTPFPGR